MKARVKSTGVLVDVIPKTNTNALHSGDNIYVCDNMVFRECELDFLNLGNSAIDWEQRRYELAKSAMQGILSDINHIMLVLKKIMRSTYLKALPSLQLFVLML